MYQGRRLKVLNTLPALVAMAMLLACKVATAQSTSLSFSYPSGFTGASSVFQTASDAAGFSGALMQPANGTVGEHESGAIWYKTQQNITSFTTQFTFQMPNTGIVGADTIAMTFCIQNSNSTTNPTAPWGAVQSGTYAIADANIAGYGSFSNQATTMNRIGNSVAIKFDMASNSGNEVTYPSGSAPSATGLYIDGGAYGALFPENDLIPSGINLSVGHVMSATIVYDGSILTMTLLDTVTHAQFRTSWPINIPSIVGGNTAWVGFTAGEIPALANDVLSWSFWQGYNPRLGTPTFSVAAGSYTSAQTVTISAPAGATVYYTTNGQQPTTSSSKYTGPLSVSSSEVVQAVAIESGYTDSLVAAANYQIAPANTPLINFPSGFASASGLVTSVGRAQLSGSAIQLTDSNSAGQEVGAAWYVVPVNVTTFTTQFTVQFTSAQGQGMTFCIQNQNPASTDSTSQYVSGGPYAMANNQNGLGYSGTTGGTGGQVAGLNTSVAVIFDLYNGSGDLTGLYTNGANPVGSSIDMTSSGVSLHSGHPLNVTLAYNGTTLALTVTDSVTKASFSHSWTINIPTTVAGNTAYVGFTASTGYFVANQYVQSWTYSTSAQTPAVPAAPTNLRVQ